MASWRRWPDESFEQYTAFEYYMKLGPLRDREDVIAAIRSMRSSTARAKADQVNKWYYHFFWDDRARNYDHYYESKLRWEFRRRELRMSVLLNELVMRTLEALLKKMVNDPRSFSFNELRLWLGTLVKLRSILEADDRVKMEQLERPLEDQWGDDMVEMDEETREFAIKLNQMLHPPMVMALGGEKIVED